MLVWILFALGLIILAKVLEKQLRLLYYSLKIPGPPSIPFVGTFGLMLAYKYGFMNGVIEYCKSYYPVWKGWGGLDFYIVTIKPTDVETVVTTFMDKSPPYQNFENYAKNSILTADASLWKVNRKLINPSFNLQVLNSFLDAYIKYTSEMVHYLGETAGTEQKDIFKLTWKTTLDNIIETLGDSEPSLHAKRYDFITAAMTFGEVFLDRSYKVWYYINFIFKFTNLSKKEAKCCKDGRVLPKNILTMADELYAAKKYDNNSMHGKRFIPHLVKTSNETNEISYEQILEETITMLHAGTESTAITFSATLMFLGAYPEIQEKVYEEIISVIGSKTKAPTLEDLNGLQYGERVIKESMRLVPAIPLISRRLDKDMKSGPYVYPAGSNIIIPIVCLHYDPAVWPDPKTFDPDRFLPEEVAKRHRCSYIPFSFGARNCIGLRYAMMSMKVLLAMIIQKFKVKTLEPKTIDDIKWESCIVIKIENIRLVFEKRE